MKSLVPIALIVSLSLLAIPASAREHCATRWFDPERTGIRPVSQLDMVPRHVGAHLMTPPPDPDVGDHWPWYIWLLNGYPQALVRECTVRGEGTTVYVVVEDSQWQTRVFQDDVDAVVNAWDNASLGIHPDQGIYEINTTYFGAAPDQLDNDPKIYVLFYDFDIAADGFFWYFDMYPDGTQPFHSNECEVVYINCSDNDPGGSYLISVMAHEFQHMIHWLTDQDEDLWVDEGMGELAMWLYGDPDPVVQFPNNPDNDLTTWNSTFADYVKTYLWTLYFYEHFGGQPSIWAVMHEPLNGVAGYDRVLDQIGSPMNFVDVYSDWTVANFIDDTSFEGGRYGYAGETLPTFASVTKSSYPVPTTSGAVLRYASDYLKFINGAPLRLRFDGADAGVWRPRVILRNGTTTHGVAEIPLDAFDVGTYNLFDFGETHDTAILVIGKTSPTGSTSYTYSTEGIPAGVEEHAQAGSLRLLPFAPNPAAGTSAIRLEVASPQRVEVDVVDVAGRVLRHLAARELAAGLHELDWDGKDDAGRSAPAGVYFARARAADGESAAKLIRLP